MSDHPMNLTDRKPECVLVPPGECQFTPEWISVPLLDRVPCGTGGTSFVLRFGVPDASKPVNLTTCACVLLKAELVSNETNEKMDVIRPYTPISSNSQVGSFDLLVKNYEEAGFLSKWLCVDLPIGGTVDVKHIEFNVKILAPFSHKKIGIIAGGTGITPMIQALHAILGEGADDQKSATENVTVLYGSKVKEDILGEEMLTSWSAAQPDKFKSVDVLSDEPADSEYDGLRGFIDSEKIAEHMPGPEMGDDCVIFVCGPPVMYKQICGPRTEKEVTGLLGEMGYKSSQVFKF